jgi:MFS family permease
MIGLVSLFADMTYEGARSIVGPFLGSLGASAAIVGFVAGLGELLGYTLRSASGYFADKIHKYWAFIFAGYFINVLAVPALALAGNWPVAAALIAAERTGRAIRRPSVQAMLSHAGKSIGSGRAFGIAEALDQTGATAGPLLVALLLSRHGGYHSAFAALLIPALLCLAALVMTRVSYPRPQELEERSAPPMEARGFSKAYWLYLAAGACMAAGFADFSLIAFHFQKAGIVAEDLIPVFYAVAMAMGALSALVLGRLLDRFGLPALVAAFFVPVFFGPLAFLGGERMALAGVILWGIGMGAQESALKAVLAEAVPAERRSTAYGMFDTGFGFAWFAGSAAMGVLYGVSIPALVAFSMVLQLAALPFLWLAGPVATERPGAGGPGS